MSQELLEKRVLALKYRPKKFQDLVGQSTVSQTLCLALDSNRLSHAYLFSGLRGSGKTSTARIMAKALLCEEGPTSKPCEQCNNCISANTNKHLDIIEMDAASNRGIDDIKDLIEHTKYKPSSARFKVFIIDEVHMLTTQAFNALLKTLEEPPGFVKFILATTDPLKLPATILSRTQHFRFNKISNNDVIHHLSYILNEENIEYETEALDILARSGQGSLRDTLTLLDQAIIFSKGNITTFSVVDMLGLIDPQVMDNIFDTVLNKKDINPLIEKLQIYEVSQICDEISIYLKNKMLEKNPKFDILLYDRFFRIIGDSKHLLSLNSDSNFVLILMLLKMSEATNLRTIDEILNQVEKVEVKQEPIKQAPINTIEQQAIVATPKEETIKEVEIKPELKATNIQQTIPKSDFYTPFDDFVEEVNVQTPRQEIQKVEVKKEEIVQEPIYPQEAEIQQKEEIVQEVIEDELFPKLREKVYERDYDLGECFERNFIYDGFMNNTLKIISYAQDDERKFLYKHFFIIKTFIHDVYGEDVELDFVKKEQKKKDKISPELKQEELAIGSMIEDIEMSSSGCVASMSDVKKPQMSQKELDINDVLNSKMLNKAKELFDVKKITVKARS